MNNLSGTPISQIRYDLYQQNQNNLYNDESKNVQDLDINDLVKDVYNDINKKDIKDIKDINDNNENDTEKKCDFYKIFDRFKKNIKDMIIILIIYIILSQEKIRLAFSYYLPMLNPTENDSVTLPGIIIYGLILSLFYGIIKSIIF